MFNNSRHKKITVSPLQTQKTCTNNHTNEQKQQQQQLQQLQQLLHDQETRCEKKRSTKKLKNEILLQRTITIMPSHPVRRSSMHNHSLILPVTPHHPNYHDRHHLTSSSPGTPTLPVVRNSTKKEEHHHQQQLMINDNITKKQRFFQRRLSADDIYGGKYSPIHDKENYVTFNKLLSSSDNLDEIYQNLIVVEQEDCTVDVKKHGNNSIIQPKTPTAKLGNVRQPFFNSDVDDEEEEEYLLVKRSHNYDEIFRNVSTDTTVSSSSLSYQLCSMINISSTDDDDDDDKTQETDDSTISIEEMWTLKLARHIHDIDDDEEYISFDHTTEYNYDNDDDDDDDIPSDISIANSRSFVASVISSIKSNDHDNDDNNNDENDSQAASDISIANSENNRYKKYRNQERKRKQQVLNWHNIVSHDQIIHLTKK